MRFVGWILLASCMTPDDAPSPEHIATSVVAAPSVVDDLEPSLCYAGRVDYRQICRDAWHPWQHAFDERCVSEAAKPGQPSTGLLGGVPFLSTGLDPRWPSDLYYLDCRAEPAPDGVMLLCCP